MVTGYLMPEEGFQEDEDEEEEDDEMDEEYTPEMANELLRRGLILGGEQSLLTICPVNTNTSAWDNLSAHLYSASLLASSMSSSGSCHAFSKTGADMQLLVLNIMPGTMQRHLHSACMSVLRHRCCWHAIDDGGDCYTTFLMM